MESFKNRETLESLDSRWYKRFEQVYFQDYIMFDGNGKHRAAEREAFLSGVSENPDLDYPNLENFDFDTKEENLFQLRVDIIEQEPNEYLKGIYRAKINELLATVRMLRATKCRDDKKFDRYSSFIFGKPTEENTKYIINQIKNKLEKKNSNNETKKQAIISLLTLFETVDLSNVKDLAEGIDFPIGSGEKEVISSAEEIHSLFLKSLQDIGLNDWGVVIDPKNCLTGMRTNQLEKVLEIPSDERIKERVITKDKIYGLIEHEIKTHALRRHNGERSKLKLLGIGLDRYIKGEEGIATYAEQQVTGKKEFSGIPKYFAIAVAKGFDGKPRDFRRTFEVMKNYYLANLPDENDLMQRAERSAWVDCIRIFRGTTGKTPGAVYTKDLAYFSGNKEIWHLVSANSDVVKTFSIGKFDPNNREHVYLLSKLGILDEELYDIENEVNADERNMSRV